MQLRPDIRIQTAIESLVNVIIPAIDPDDAPAQEQAQLVVGTLRLAAQWLPLEYRYDRDELSRPLSVTTAVGDGLTGGPRTTGAGEDLARAAVAAHDVLARAGAEPSELQDAVRALRVGLGELVAAVFEDGEPPTRDAVGESVLELSEHQLLRERSAVAAQGFEGEAHGLPPLEQLLSDG